MTEKAKMLSGEWYFPGDPELVADQAQARELLRRLNNAGLSTRCHALLRRWLASTKNETVQNLLRAGAEAAANRRRRLLTNLLGSIGEGSNVEPGFYCDYGFNIHIGKMSGLNFGCILLDCGRIEIGDYTLLGPGVHIYAVTHPMEALVRRGGPDSRNCRGLSVKIGNDCWIGGGSHILPGITIGDGCIVGAGSVVTKDVPPGTTVVGNPARCLWAMPT